MLCSKHFQSKGGGHDLSDGRGHERPVYILRDKVVAFWINYQDHLRGSERGDLLLDPGVPLGGG